MCLRFSISAAKTTSHKTLHIQCTYTTWSPVYAPGCIVNHSNYTKSSVVLCLYCLGTVTTITKDKVPVWQYRKVHLAERAVNVEMWTT